MTALVRVVVVVVIAGAMLRVVTASLVGLAAVGLVLFIAYRRHPAIRPWSYFGAGRWPLPLFAWAAGAMAQFGGVDLYRWASGASGHPLLALVELAVSAGCTYLLIFTFEGKVMQSIFQLIPESEQAAFAAQLDDIDAGTKGADGHAADFSELDQAGVIAQIEQRVIGQDPVVESVVSTAFRRAKLSRTGKPVGTFLFVGATGAGKTELAKALASELFAGRMIRIDCNELSAEQGVARLVGPPPGYVGSDRGSDFCREMGRLGTGVILFDEIEKADPAVLKTIMSLLDEARITEQATSRTYSARGFVIVLTSNAAAAEIGKIAATEADPTMRSVKVKDALKDNGFLPEVLARIDGIFPFAPLASRDIARIIERFLLGFARDAGVELVSADSALLLDLVTKANKTRDYGVREVVRSVENAVVDGLLDLKEHGYSRAAIKVVDGHASVQPVAAAAGA